MKVEINGTVTNKYSRNDGSTTIEVTERTQHSVNNNNVSKIELNSGSFDMSALQVLDPIHIKAEVMGAVSGKGFRWLTIADAEPVK
jgi:hypothetical protein